MRINLILTFSQYAKQLAYTKEERVIDMQQILSSVSVWDHLFARPEFCHGGRSVLYNPMTKVENFSFSLHGKDNEGI